MNEGTNEGSNDGSKLKQYSKKQKELEFTEREMAVWDQVALGRTYGQISKELGISKNTVTKHINNALERIRDWSGRQAEDWRNAQLLIVNDQISRIIDDTMQEAVPACTESGDQIMRSGKWQWEINEREAAKIRNMARITLQKFLAHQADLLALTVERKEVKIEQQTVIGVYDFGPSDMMMEEI